MSDEVIPTLRELHEAAIASRLALPPPDERKLGQEFYDEWYDTKEGHEFHSALIDAAPFLLLVVEAVAQWADTEYGSDDELTAAQWLMKKHHALDSHLSAASERETPE
jgi:hypothetical protein